MEDKERQIWFDLFMYTILVICITYIIFLNQMQRYFLYIVLIGYAVATSYKIVVLTQHKHHK